MAFVEPKYSKTQINQAGKILAEQNATANTDWVHDWLWAVDVLANWRACHGYPINTFQSTLRTKLRSIDSSAIVAQRLKRTPSIISKLRRFDGMQLARMQDIGGLRAVVDTVESVRLLEDAYKGSRFQHELVSFKDYIKNPKDDGYRGIHLIYRYRNKKRPQYNGLSIELQIRTRLQHAWATAVETMGTFLGQALKSGQGEDAWKDFFVKTSAAIAINENSPSVPGFELKSKVDVFVEVSQAENKLRVLEKLKGFAIAADRISTERGQGAYHLVILDLANKTVSIRPYSNSSLEQANKDYAEIEQKIKNGEQKEVVLVSAGPVDALRKAYPNYFLDTQEFVSHIEYVIDHAKYK